MKVLAQLPDFPPPPVKLPEPDYDSGWIDLPRGEGMGPYTIITHNLGTKEIMIVGWVRHNFTYWGDPVDIPFHGYFERWERSLHYAFVVLDENRIEVVQREHDPLPTIDTWCRVRIWRL